MVVSAWNRRRLKARCMVLSSDMSMPVVGAKGLRVVVSISPGEQTKDRLVPAVAWGTVSGEATSIVKWIGYGYVKCKVKCNLRRKTG